MSGETQTPKSDNPDDQCPRVVGSGSHYFEWVDITSDQVRCINCGQIRTRTRDADVVDYRGTIDFPAIPLETIPTSMEAPEPSVVPQDHKPLVREVGEVGTYENPLASTAESTGMASAPSVLGNSSPDASPSSSD